MSDLPRRLFLAHAVALPAICRRVGTMGQGNSAPAAGAAPGAAPLASPSGFTDYDGRIVAVSDRDAIVEARSRPPLSPPGGARR